MLIVPPKVVLSCLSPETRQRRKEKKIYGVSESTKFTTLWKSIGLWIGNGNLFSLWKDFLDWIYGDVELIPESILEH
jgi:hypothetical protein